MTPSSKTLTFFTAGLLGLSFAAVLVRAQGAGMSVTPANPTILAGQTQQFAASGPLTPTAVAGGGYHTCLLYADRSVRCTGLNNWGQLGNGGFANSSTPILVSGMTTAASIGTGIEHTCALLADGTMRCWGTNYVGQLGDGTIGGLSAVPKPVQGISDGIGIAVGGFHNCAILADRTVRCWGRNQDGQVGNGDNTTDVAAPQQPVSGLGAVAAVSAGGYHTCALMPDATVRCWGRNTRGQLGDGSSSFWSSTPVAVSGMTNAAAVSGGFYHTCALLGDGTVQCWGDNDSGQIGNTLPYSSVPTTVSGISGAVAISAGAYHSCAVLSDGAIRCWGRNANGQLGNGTTTNSSSPVPVSGIAGPAVLAAGGLHTCALMPDRSGQCWGWDTYGQLGNGNATDSSTPVKVGGTGVAWTSSNTAAATIAASGRATGVGRGATTITVTDSAGNAASTLLSVRTMETLSVTKSGIGNGTVTSSPAGINCGAACSGTYLDGTVVTLTATPGPLSVLVGWTGCDTVSGTSCTVTMSAAKSVNAEFLGVPIN
jgi:alpha-tubulin suppressor-like RCC1 family protein